MQNVFEPLTSEPPSVDDTVGLIHDVHKLLTRSESELEAEGVKSHLQTLERWLESYRRGLDATRKLNEKGDAYLQEMRDRLKLSLEEMQRLDDEGGATPMTKEQRQRMEDLTKAIRRIDRLMASMSDASFKLEIPEMTS